MRTILHIDFNSYFASVEQQANPRLRGRPIGVTGGDRMQRTVIGAASVEAKRFGVKTGMQLWEAKKICPQIILVPGDSDKYLVCTQRFLNILKDYSPYLEVFSIDECFLELPPCHSEAKPKNLRSFSDKSDQDDGLVGAIQVATEIKDRIRSEVGEWITCSVGISYNRIMAKLAGSLYKPDGMVVIADEEAACFILDRVELNEICGIGSRIKQRLYNLGITNFSKLRLTPRASLIAAFKSYGGILYNLSHGIDYSPVTPFYEKAAVKSIGHRHTINHDTASKEEVKQLLLKLTELVARRLRSKQLVGRTVSCWFRNALDFSLPGGGFSGGGMQVTIFPTNDGLEIFQGAWKIFNQLWAGQKIRMVGVSIANLKPLKPQNLTFLEDILRKDKITRALDQINDKYGEFTLQRGVLLGTQKMVRKPNPFLSDRRFKI